MASVRQLTTPNREGKRPWVVEYTDAAGKRRRATPKSGLKKDADKLRQKIEREIEDGVHTALSETASVKDVARDFLRAMEMKQRDGEISQNYYLSLRAGVIVHIEPFFAKTSIADLTASLVRSFYDHLRAKMSPYSAKKRLTQLAALEDFAVKRELTKRSVARSICPEYRPSRKPVRTFTIDEMAQLIKAADERCSSLPRYVKRDARTIHLMRMYLHLAAMCGLRYGEISALKWSNIDLAARVVKVRHSLAPDGTTKGPKSKSGLRDVPMPAHLAVWLREWRERFDVPNDEGLVFLMPSGARMKSAAFHANYWLPLLRASGVDLLAETPHFHALRHFAASWMIENGLAITEVASLLGHSHVDMTLQVYAHPIIGGHRRAEAMDRMAITLLAAPATIDGEAGSVAT